MQGVEADGAVLGVCCYTTDGISRKNGKLPLDHWTKNITCLNITDRSHKSFQKLIVQTHFVYYYYYFYY
jgi:hypothetical protein